MKTSYLQSKLLRFASSGLAALTILASMSATSAQIMQSGTGTTAASILPAVNAFRTDLGTLNANVPGSFGSGRREINWDGVPDTLAAPNNLPANFFNVNSPRGVVFSTAGTGFQVSAKTSSGNPTQFDNLNPTYSSNFEPFSPERLFTSLGSNILDVTFFIPGSSTPALTTGFGSVFSDVDLANTTSIQFFDAANMSLGTFFVPATSGNETFSFLGVSFTNPIVSRVRITNGNLALGPNETSVNDLVVMDDFLYGEPRAVPDGGMTIVLLGSAVAALMAAGGLRTRLTGAR